MYAFLTGALAAAAFSVAAWFVYENATVTIPERTNDRAVELIDG